MTLNHDKSFDTYGTMIHYFRVDGQEITYSEDDGFQFAKYIEKNLLMHGLKSIHDTNPDQIATEQSFRNSGNQIINILGKILSPRIYENDSEI
jgi:hypothetical protein